MGSIRYCWYLSAVDAKTHAFPESVADNDGIAVIFSVCDLRVPRGVLVRKFIPPVCSACMAIVPLAEVVRS